MKKEKYESPAVHELEMVVEPIMNVVSGETGNAGVGDGSTDENDPDLAGGKRAGWGNLWK